MRAWPGSGVFREDRPEKPRFQREERRMEIGDEEWRYREYMQ